MRSLTKSLAIAIAFLTTACGPLGYLNRVAKDANFAVAEAKAIGAEEHAPYEYWGSVAYLEQSKAMMGYSEYERAFDYGTRAVQLAEEAKAKSERATNGGRVETAAKAETETETETESGGSDESGEE